MVNQSESDDYGVSNGVQNSLICTQPTRDFDIRDKTVSTAHSLAALYPALAEVTPWSAESAAGIARTLIADETAEIRRAALAQWRIELDGDVDRQRKWIKRSSAELASPTSKTLSALAHPASTVEEAFGMWNEKWNGLPRHRMRHPVQTHTASLSLDTECTTFSWTT